MPDLTLSEAIRLGRLDDFVRQEETRVAAVPAREFNSALTALIKAPQSEDQTSRSLSRGGSSGK